MAIQIANLEVVRKIENIAALLQTTKTAAVERALDAYSSHLMQAEIAAKQQQLEAQRYADMMGLLSKIEAPQPGQHSEMEWDDNGLPI